MNKKKVINEGEDSGSEFKEKQLKTKKSQDASKEKEQKKKNETHRNHTLKVKKESHKRDTSFKNKYQKAQEENKLLKDQLLRTAAELDNFRKRTEREFEAIYQNANAELIKAILPVIDDLERSLKSSEKSDPDEFRKGVEFILQKLHSILKNQGLEPMESIGKPFDVDCHDALLQVEKKGVESDIVVEEHEKGYMLHGKVLRHAKVILSK